MNQHDHNLSPLESDSQVFESDPLESQGDDPRKLTSIISLGLLFWGTMLAFGAYRAGQTIWHFLIVEAASVGFVGLWWFLIVIKQRSEDDTAKSGHE